MFNTLDTPNVVSREMLQLIQGTPLLLRVEQGSRPLIDWATENRERLECLLQTQGALLIRGLKFASSEQFASVLMTLFGEPLQEWTSGSASSSPRRDNVYTATEYQPELHIPQHNAKSYSHRWPLRLGFLCTTPAERGWAMPICDSRKVYQEIPQSVRQRFERDGVMYVRHYSESDIPWSEIFQSQDRNEIEQFCREECIDFQWQEGNRLRTCQVNQARARHPVTGERVWFNQAHRFHISALDLELTNCQLATRQEHELSRNTYYGDGSPVELSDLQAIRNAYERHTLRFEWQRNDLLLLDNMLFSHGRDPYAGNRHVLVGMARTVDAKHLET